MSDNEPSRRVVLCPLSVIKLESPLSSLSSRQSQLKSESELELSREMLSNTKQLKACIIDNEAVKSQENGKQLYSAAL